LMATWCPIPELGGVAGDVLEGEFEVVGGASVANLTLPNWPSPRVLWSK
jgi:hypothetical protein